MNRATLTILAVLLLGVAVPSSTNAQDVNYYNVNKIDFLTQTGLASPTTDTFAFGSVVGQTSGGSLSSGSLTLPAGSASASPLAYILNGNGNLSLSGPNSPTQAGLDAEYNTGTYVFNINGGSGSYSASITTPADAYPASTPTITNTNWSGGALVIDPAQSFTLTWNSFSNFSTGDSVQLFDSSGAFNFFYNTNTTSQTFAADTFAPNTSYAFTLGFSDDAANNDSSIPNALGEALYINDTRFTVQAPEPSTTAILSIGMGFLYFICRRGR